MKAVQALVIQPDGTVTETVLRGFEDYKAALNDAWLEAIRLDIGVMYVDDEFLLKGPGPSDINRIATTIARKWGRVADETVIFGPSILVGPTDDNGDDTNVPTELGQRVHQLQRELTA